MGRLAFRAWLLGTLGLLAGWPLVATGLEATQAPWRLVRALRSGGWDCQAGLIVDVWGADPESASGVALDPAATARLLGEDGSLARPARLALETLNLIGWVLVLALPLATLLALLLFRTDLRGRGLAVLILAVVLFIPLPLHASSWLGALGNVGRAQAIGSAPLLVGRTGAAVVHALAGLPWAVLLVGLGLRTVEPELEESALLDRPAWSVCFSVTLRRGIGAIGAAALALSVLTASEMTITDLLQVRTYAEEAYTQYSLGRGPADAATVSLPPLLVLGIAIFMAARWFERADPARLSSAYGRCRRWSLGRWKAASEWLVFGLFTALVAVPLYSLIWRAGRVGGRARLGMPPVWSISGLQGTLTYAAGESAGPIATSLLLAVAAATLAAGLSWSLAWAARESRHLRVLMLATLALTLATPGPVVGMALKLGYRWFSWVHDTPAIVVMAQAVRTLPYAILILWPALAVLPAGLLEAAAIEGHGGAGRALRVALPLTIRPLVAAWSVALVIGFGELPATNLVLPPGLTTITFQLWSLLHTGVESHLAGVALVTLAVIAVLVIAITAIGLLLPGRAGEG
ncbi:MAG: ABC transporter permease subunit [Isosphaeraceae bacterium]